MSDRIGFRASRGIKLTKPAPLKRPADTKVAENLSASIPSHNTISSAPVCRHGDTSSVPVTSSSMQPPTVTQADGANDRRLIRRASRSQLKLSKPPPLKAARVEEKHKGTIEMPAPVSCSDVGKPGEFIKTSYTSQVSQDSGIADMGGSYSRQSSLKEGVGDSSSTSRRSSHQDDLDWGDVNREPTFTLGTNQLQSTSFYVNQAQPFNSLMVGDVHSSRKRSQDNLTQSSFKMAEPKAAVALDSRRPSSNYSTSSMGTYRLVDGKGHDPDGTPLAGTPIPGTPILKVRKPWNRSQETSTAGSEHEAEVKKTHNKTYNADVQMESDLCVRSVNHKLDMFLQTEDITQGESYQTYQTDAEYVSHEEASQKSSGFPIRKSDSDFNCNRNSDNRKRHESCDKIRRESCDKIRRESCDEMHLESGDKINVSDTNNNDTEIGQIIEDVNTVTLGEPDLVEDFERVSRSMDYRKSVEADTNSSISRSSTSVDIDDVSSCEESEQAYAWSQIEDLSERSFNETAYAWSLIEDLSEGIKHMEIKKDAVTEDSESMKKSDSSVNVDDVEEELAALGDGQSRHEYINADRLKYDTNINDDNSDSVFETAQTHYSHDATKNISPVSDYGVKRNSYSSLKSNGEPGVKFREKRSISWTDSSLIKGSSQQNCGSVSLSDKLEPMRFGRPLSYGGYGTGYVIVQRQPLAPTSLREEFERVERGQPDGLYSAKGRRSMFHSYKMCRGEASSSEKISYDANELLKIGSSPDSRATPDSWSYLAYIHPDVCLPQVKNYFDTRRYQEERSYVMEVCCVVASKTGLPGNFGRQESVDSATSLAKPGGFGRPSIQRHHSYSGQGSQPTTDYHNNQKPAFPANKVSSGTDNHPNSARPRGFGVPPGKRAGISFGHNSCDTQHLSDNRNLRRGTSVDAGYRSVTSEAGGDQFHVQASEVDLDSKCDVRVKCDSGQVSILAAMSSKAKPLSTFRGIQRSISDPEGNQVRTDIVDHDQKQKHQYGQQSFYSGDFNRNNSASARGGYTYTRDHYGSSDDSEDVPGFYVNKSIPKVCPW